VQLLNHIHELLDNQEKSQMVWLHGTAGVGKSAVAFTVAERMRGLKVTEQTTVEKRLAGTFFFSRKHTQRCTTGYFFATLAYQLVSNFHSLRQDVNRTIHENPGLLHPDKSLYEQLEAFFLQPLRGLRLRLRGCLPLVFVVDALDECTNETEVADLISLLGHALRQPDLPVIHILLTSRSEPHIRSAFQEEVVRTLVCEIPVRISGGGVTTIISLDGADVDNDIYIFLEHSFKELGSRYPNFPQPQEDELSRLASRAGRRFIVASTMMKFINDGYNDPRDRLQLMLELTSKLLPGTEVYKLYDHILSTCADPKRAYVHLSVVAMLADPLPISQISELLGPGEGRDVETVLMQLRSVVDIPADGNSPINIHHSSIRDYISDPSNCSLSEVRCTTSPHSLIAHSSFRLMIQYLPESTALLDALSELNQHSQAMESHDPQSLKNTLVFMIQPEPLRVLIGLSWLRGDRSSKFYSWLETLDGRAWLRTLDARNWLQVWGGRQWLQTHVGHEWLKTHGGQDWLQGWGARHWLQTWGGHDWLNTQGGKDWLQTQGGKNWLKAQAGRHWLQTQGGQDWLWTQGGQDWLQTQGGQDWLQTQYGKDWLQTQGGQDWLQTQGGQDWLKSKPDGQGWLKNTDRLGQDWLQMQGGPDWLQTLGGQDWLQAKGGHAWLCTRTGKDWLWTQAGEAWLQTQGAEDWLQTQGGQDWLRTQGGGQDWLQTQDGPNWLQTQGGQGWLQTREGQDWLQTWRGNQWLQTQEVQNWLQTNNGQGWLQTLDGQDWLQTESGKDWLQTSHGQAWQSTPAASFWVIMEEFSRMLEEISKYMVTPELSLLPTFQTIQQFRNLPDFLMFPVFLAFRYQDHSTYALSQPHSSFPSNIEVIDAMKAFIEFAEEPHKRSHSASGALNYACQNWSVHLLRAPNPWDDCLLSHRFKVFWDCHLLSWLERQWCSKGLHSCLVILSQAQKFTKVCSSNFDSSISASHTYKSVPPKEVQD
jgi:hypothetical protein